MVHKRPAQGLTIRVGQNIAKVPKPKTLLFHPLLWPKMLCLVWSNWFQPQIWLSWGHSNYLMSQPIWKSLGSYFLSWNWKSMWKSYILSIFCFLKFFGCLWFLGLYLVKKSIFGQFWPKPLFASKINTYKHKSAWKQFLIEFGTSFVHVCWLLGQKLVLVKIARKWTFFSKLSLKNYKRPNFFIE